MRKLLKKSVHFCSIFEKWPYFDGIFSRFFLVNFFSSFCRSKLSTLFFFLEKSRETPILTTPPPLNKKLKLSTQFQLKIQFRRRLHREAIYQELIRSEYLTLQSPYRTRTIVRGIFSSYQALTLPSSPIIRLNCRADR